MTMVTITARRGSFPHRFWVAEHDVQTSIAVLEAIGMTEIEVWS